MPLIVLQFLQVLPLLISAVKDSAPIVDAAKNVIAGWVGDGTITEAQQNSLMSHVDALMNAALNNQEPPEFVIESDPK